jgi:hypothetical protein
MLRLKLPSLICLIVISHVSTSQNLIGLEIGTGFFSPQEYSVNRDSQLRPGGPSYPRPIGFNYLYPQSFDQSFSGDIKIRRIGGFFERNLTRHFAVSSGINYAQLQSNLDPSGQSIFYKTGEDGLDTHYLQVTAIKQTTHFVSVPVHITFYPSTAKTVRFYFKAAFENNFNVATTGKVNFYNDEMSKYEDEVLDFQQKASVYNLSFYLAGGIRYVAPEFQVGFEVAGPSVFVNPENLGMIQPGTGMGIQFAVAFPLKPHENE